MHSRVPDALQRVALLRRAGTQRAAISHLERWAPALQRIAEEALRCVRGTRSFSNQRARVTRVL